MVGAVSRRCSRARAAVAAESSRSVGWLTIFGRNFRRGSPPQPSAVCDAHSSNDAHRPIGEVFATMRLRSTHRNAPPPPPMPLAQRESALEKQKVLLLLLLPAVAHATTTTTTP
ncbi:uncharacterized protein Tco025E_01465 [Trypanosoma conorhini]|uniref:Uncharacterized protein n=1 Tax=Trypanosoma conorhini TaxID=83891 RepID=A0A422Q8I2_9TRYP|nr:uncharacterized protein Tco025E_01465 [Trypanosoma conorhini]RNF26249.1 hypothetical protein Tco025E_01465 [Trypanosoma conorhini]